MAKIEDTGKVWFPGKFSPEYAIRVDSTVFVPGGEKDEAIHCWVETDSLYADLHDEKSARRTLRRFALNLTPSTPAALFNGFEKTKHADVLVVTHKAAGVEEFFIEGEAYNKESIDVMDSKTFRDHLARDQEGC